MRLNEAITPEETNTFLKMGKCVGITTLNLMDNTLKAICSNNVLVQIMYFFIAENVAKTLSLTLPSTIYVYVMNTRTFWVVLKKNNNRRSSEKRGGSAAFDSITFGPRYMPFAGEGEHIKRTQLCRLRSEHVYTTHHSTVRLPDRDTVTTMIHPRV